MRGSSIAHEHDNGTPDNPPDLLAALAYPSASKGDYHYRSGAAAWSIVLNLYDRGPLGVFGSYVPFFYRRYFYRPSRCDPRSRIYRHHHGRHIISNQGPSYWRVVHRCYGTTVSVHKKKIQLSHWRQTWKILETIRRGHERQCAASFYRQFFCLFRSLKPW